MNSFDLISDIHLDFWIREAKRNPDYDEKDDEVIISDFVTRLTPEEPSTVLVIAGDLGHNNPENYKMLSNFTKHYANVLFTWGNHDLYLFPSTLEHQFFSHSIERWGEMKELAQSIPGVVPLDGNYITIDGTTFGGTGMWYDMKYGMELGYSRKRLEEYWYSNFSDSHYIGGVPDVYHEKLKLIKIFRDCDVIVSHISPDTSRIQYRFQLDPLTAFYYFDGFDFLSYAKGKIWCYGHVHYRNAYYHQDGCFMVNHALGYPHENNFTKAVTIPLHGDNLLTHFGDE